MVGMFYEVRCVISVNDNVNDVDEYDDDVWFYDNIEFHDNVNVDAGKDLDDDTKGDANVQW